MRSALIGTCLLSPFPLAPRSDAATIAELQKMDPLAMPTVESTATVIFSNRRDLFLSDSTGAIYGSLDPGENHFQPGDRLKVKATLTPGNYAPSLMIHSATLSGKTAVPNAIDAGFFELMSADLHCQRVRVSGTVLDFSFDQGRRTIFALDVSGQSLPVVSDFPSPKSAELRATIGSEVEVTGIAVGRFNEAKQMIRPMIRVAHQRDFRFLRRATTAPFRDLPLRTATSLFQFDPGAPLDRRRRIEGTLLSVLPTGPGQVELAVRDGTGAARVSLASYVTPPDNLTVGDQVEIVGFPQMSSYSVTLTHADLLREGKAPAPAPIRTTMEELFGGRHAGDLVAIEGTMVSASSSQGRIELRIQSGERSIDAVISGSTSPSKTDLANSGIREGAQVRLEGIARVEKSLPFLTAWGKLLPQKVSLRLDGIDSVTVIKAAPWTGIPRKTLGQIALGLAIASSAAAAWIIILNRQVSSRTAALETEISRNAAGEERSRIARELHDSLEQCLAGVRMQLERGITETSNGSPALQLARRMVEHGETETRAAIAGLRAPQLDPEAFPSALKSHAEDVATNFGGSATLTFDYSCVHPCPPVPRLIQHQLLRIIQEAVANAIKHGGADLVAVKLVIDNKDVSIAIGDDGRGFDRASAPGPPQGHFGLTGIEERVARHKGKLTITTGHGKGTTVAATFPLPKL